MMSPSPRTDTPTPVTLTVDDALAARLGAVLRGGDVLLLDGDLGAGKTTLVQGVGRHWGVDEGVIRSPTFALMNVLALPDFDLVHADLYRMEQATEVESSGLAELLGEPDCVCVIEWPRLAAPYLPADPLRLSLRFDPATGRRTAIANAVLARRLGDVA